MFHLNAGVHFHEVEIPMIVHEILNGAGVCVADALAEADRCIAHLFAKLGRHEWRRALLDDLLVASLERAVALTEVDHTAVNITKNLEFNVVWIDDEFLDVNRAISKCLFRFHTGGVISLHQAAFVAGDAHAATAATGDSFDHHGKADFSGDAEGLSFGINRAVAAGRNRDASLAGTIAGGIFIAHEANRLRRGADELDVATGADFSEMRILRQKSIPRMDRVGVADLSGADDAVNLEIALRTDGWPYTDSLVSELHMKAIDIGLRINGHRLDAQFSAGANDAKSNFAAIGDQNFFKHGGVAEELLEAEEGLSKLHRLAIFGTDFRNDTRDLGLDLVHDFHGFDNADNGIRRHLLADREE